MIQPKSPEFVQTFDALVRSGLRRVASPPEVETENNLRFSIGRYIHDGPQQQLQAAIRLLREQAEMLASAPPPAHPQLSETNRQLLALLNQADSELSLIRRETLPADPRAGNLRMSLESYILEDFPRLHPAASFQLKYRLDKLVAVYDSPEQAKATSEKMLISLFIREGLKNAYKHAQAKRVELDSKIVFYSGKPAFPAETAPAPAEGYYLRLAIKDNGCGFELKGLAELEQTGQHRSFYDFEDRARLLGGFSRLESEVNKGTLWEIYLPLPPALGKAFKADAA